MWLRVKAKLLQHRLKNLKVIFRASKKNGEAEQSGKLFKLYENSEMEHKVS